jgi:hypothetical protein
MRERNKPSNFVRDEEKRLKRIRMNKNTPGRTHSVKIKLG